MSSLAATSIMQRVAQQVEFDPKVLSRRLPFELATQQQTTVQNLDSKPSFPLVDLTYIDPNVNSNKRLLLQNNNGYSVDEYGLAVQDITKNAWIYGKDMTYPIRVLFDELLFHYSIIPLKNIEKQKIELLHQNDLLEQQKEQYRNEVKEKLSKKQLIQYK